MHLRLLSALTVLTIVAVFFVPSTIAIYTAVNGTAWDLLDVSPGELLAPALIAGFFVGLDVNAWFSPVISEVTHPVSHTPLFELDCALIC